MLRLRTAQRLTLTPEGPARPHWRVERRKRGSVQAALQGAVLARGRENGKARGPFIPRLKPGASWPMLCDWARDRWHGLRRTPCSCSTLPDRTRWGRRANEQRRHLLSPHTPAVARPSRWGGVAWGREAGRGATGTTFGCGTRHDLLPLRPSPACRGSPSGTPCTSSGPSTVRAYVSVQRLYFHADMHADMPNSAWRARASRSGPTTTVCTVRISASAICQVRVPLRPACQAAAHRGASPALPRRVCVTAGGS
jgi:hypothetical protein